MRPSPLLPALLLACLCCLPTPAQARCALAAEAAADLARWKASGFVVADRTQRNQRVSLNDEMADALARYRARKQADADAANQVL